MVKYNTTVNKHKIHMNYRRRNKYIYERIKNNDSIVDNFIDKLLICIHIR